MEAHLPEEKLARIQKEVSNWLSKKSATKREILSLVGVLQHAAKVVRPGHTFVCRMYSVAAGVQELDYYTRLNKGFQSDLHWWKTFLKQWNGTSFLQLSYPRHNHSNGCLWLQWQWPPAWDHLPIMAKELVPRVLACVVWKPLLQRSILLFQCDNMAVVATVQKGSAKDDHIMHLLRSLWFFATYYDIVLLIEHIAGECNVQCNSRSVVML